MDQENAVVEIAANEPELSEEGLKLLGAALMRMFAQYEADRKGAELQWLKNMRQKKGVYEPHVEKAIGENRSKAYPRLTRVKCVGMLSKLMNLLFPVSDDNWSVAPSEVPDLHQDDLQKVLDAVVEMAGENEPDTDMIEEAVRTFAKKRSRNLELLIKDQLQDLGGSRLVSYVYLARKVMQSGIDYGVGVLHGPFDNEVTLRTWKRDMNGRLMAVPKTAHRPQFEFVPIWDYYADMSAAYLHQMKGQFQRKVLTKHGVIELKQRGDTIKDNIDKALRDLPEGNYTKRTYETDLTSMGKQKNVSDGKKGSYELLMWDGYVDAKELIKAGVKVPEDLTGSDVRAQVWMIGQYIVKAELDPWTDLLKPGETMQMYHHFIFEEDEANLLGIGLPEIMVDSQMGVCEAVRITLDNASVQRNFEVNTALLRADNWDLAIRSDKAWYRDDDSPSTIGVPAVRVIEMPMHIAEMQSVSEMFKSFADQETFVSGNMENSKGPSEPFRTATGASMLKGEAALPYKDVIRNFDVFTESVIGAIVKFNRVFNEDDDENIRGDFRPVARGASSLMAKEVLGMQLDNLAATLTEEEKQYIKYRELAMARVRVRDLETADIVVDEAEAKRIDAAREQAQAEARQQQSEMVKAELRSVLAAALKDVSLANKNAAAAEAQTANTILDAMEVGLNATDIIDKDGREGIAATDQSEQGVASDDFADETAGAAFGGDAAQAGAMPVGPVP